MQQKGSLQNIRCSLRSHPRKAFSLPRTLSIDYQKRKFAPTCMIRGSRALVTSPNVPPCDGSPSLISELGLLNWAWLNKLNASKRNSRDLDSVILVFFDNAMS